MTIAISETQLLDAEVLNNPYPFYRRLQQEAPVWRVPGTKIFVVTQYSLLEEAARRVEDFSSNILCVLYRGRNGVPVRFVHNINVAQTLATADPPMHAIHRKAVFSSLNAKRMATMSSKIEEITDTCISNILEAGTADFMSALANIVPMSVVCELVGFKGKDINTLLQAAFDSTAIVGGALSVFQLIRCIFRSVCIQFWLDGQLRPANPDDDTLLATMKRSLSDKTLNRAECRAVLHILLAAGGESTTSLLGNAVRILAEDPVRQNELRSNPQLIPRFLEEVLRLESPFRSMLRSVPKDTTLGGVNIPAGSTVLLFWSAGNRDPEAFANPDEIDIERAPKHLTFGRGIHSCLGAPLARLEGKIVLSKLLERTSHIALDPKQPPQWVQSLQVRRHEKLPIIVTPR
ncbi:MAG TPA: cytochrome P450 [Dongiaceae bacterium]|nr:cytochrome P450 [Dongiaceae bacterium]